MLVREAVLNDIESMQSIRNSVRENALSDPSRVTYKDYESYLLNRGKGWVCEKEGLITGFAVIDVVDFNVWALFVDPRFEKLGIGKHLHDRMLDWYFQKFTHTLWLSTAPHTRAERFYRNAGWEEKGMHGKGEIRFEMSFSGWEKNLSDKD